MRKMTSDARWQWLRDWSRPNTANDERERTYTRRALKDKCERKLGRQNKKTRRFIALVSLRQDGASRINQQNVERESKACRRSRKSLKSLKIYNNSRAEQAKKRGSYNSQRNQQPPAPQKKKKMGPLHFSHRDLSRLSPRCRATTDNENCTSSRTRPHTLCRSSSRVHFFFPFVRSIHYPHHCPFSSFLLLSSSFFIFFSFSSGCGRGWWGAASASLNRRRLQMGDKGRRIDAVVDWSPCAMFSSFSLSLFIFLLFPRRCKKCGRQKNKKKKRIKQENQRRFSSDCGLIDMAGRRRIRSWGCFGPYASVWRRQNRRRRKEKRPANGTVSLRSFYTTSFIFWKENNARNVDITICAIDGRHSLLPLVVDRFHPMCTHTAQ